MEIKPIHGNVIGLDIHQKQVTACAITVSDAGSVGHQFKEFGTFLRDCRELVAWAEQMQPDVVVMESTGIYWKSVHRALRRAGMNALVVNARHVKQVPGRKTDIADSLWLAMLARAGLLRGSFVISEDLDALRLVARQRQKLVGCWPARKTGFTKCSLMPGCACPR
jgi:transposase